MAKIKNKQELISKIKNAEGFSNEEKSQMLALLNENKTYGLVWEKSTEEAWEMMKDYVPVLKEDESKRIDHGSENPNHILIEGDNLNALTALSYTHEGKIDVIYIDPPYNTGNNDFVYNDKFIGEDDSYRHSKWLSFMEKRLKIARRLLSDKGVIFISIDDNEVSNLKLLCDEIFLGSFLQKIIIESNPRGSQSSKYFANVHEYLLCYSKKTNPDISFGLSKNEDNLSEYSSEDDKGKFRLLGLRQRGGAWRRSDRPLLYYPIYVNPSDHSVSLEKNDLYNIEVVPQRPSGEDSRWTWGKDKFQKNKDLLQGVLVNEGTEKEKWDIYRKDYLLDEKGEEKLAKVKSIWNEKEINYQNGGNEIKEIIGDGKFSYPKPLFLLDKVLRCSSHENSIVLDFFAGSGTTLHATMQLNAEDGGHRQCILVTNNENNICEEVTYERNKRVIEGYTTPKGDKVEGLKANNLRYFKVGFTPREKTDENMFRLAKNSVNLLRIKHDVYKETQFGELENPYKRYRYFEEDGKQLLVILDTELIGDIVEQLEEMEVSKPIPTYVFATGAYPFTEDFESVANKVELYPLPHGIYQACERNMPKMVYKEIENPDGISLSNEELETSMDDLTKEEA